MANMPLSPALLKAAKGTDRVPAHLLSMIPETHKAEILVDPGVVREAEYNGQKFVFPMVLTIYPLVYSVCTELSDAIQKMLNSERNSFFNCVHSGSICTKQKMVCAEKKIAEFPAPSPCQAKDCEFFTRQSSDNLFTAFVNSGLADSILSYAVCGNVYFADFFRDYMTIHQKVDALSKIYQMNVNLNVFTDNTSRKNAESLLGMLPIQMAEMDKEAEQQEKTPSDNE